MKPQMVQLIRTLKESNIPITSSKLADELDISPRSVKSYIQEINRISPGTISSSRKGYTIDLQKANSLLHSSQTTIPQDSNERVSYIINCLIQRGPTNAFELADELYISYNTLKGELPKVRKMLSKNDLELINQSDTLIVNGLEKNKRRLLSSILYDESHNNFVNYDKMQTSFPWIDINFIKQTILNEFKAYNYYINDYSLENLILHVTITIDRIQNGYVSNDPNAYQKNIRSHEHELAGAIIAKLEDYFDITFGETETTEFALLIISRASNLNYQEVTFENVKEYIGEDVYQLTEMIINDFNSYFYVDLSEPEFFVRFALHIKNLLIRANQDYFSKNPLTTTIKQSCPLIYDASVNAARIIYEQTDISLNEDEIAYIAFHIGGALELQSTIKEKLSVCLFCPNYYDLNTQLSEKISSLFHESIIITDIVTEETELVQVKSDLLISTLPIDVAIEIPVVVITPFLNSADNKAISAIIDNLLLTKKKKLFKERLTSLLKPELFSIKKRAQSKEEIIHQMCNRLYQLGYSSEYFEEEVLDRDNLSSVSFGNFAIPHAMKMHENVTAMSVMILQQPVKWDENEVQLIIMLCFNRNDRYIFNEVFEPLTMILTNPTNMKKIINAKDYQEFIDLLTDMLEA